MSRCGEGNYGGSIGWGVYLISLFLPFLKEGLRGFPTGSKASRHALEVPRCEGRQHDLAVSRFEMHSRPRLDVERGANLLWDHDLAFRADDGGFHVSYPFMPGTLTKT